MNKQVSMEKRITVGLMDIGIVTAASLILMCLASLSFGQKILYYSILFPIVYFFYMIIGELVCNGQTIGKRMGKLRVSGKNGKEPSSIDFIVRNIVKTMPMLIIVLFPDIWIITLLLAGIYFLVPLVHNKNLAVHDIVGATVVVMQAGAVEEKPKVDTVNVQIRDEKEEEVAEELPEEKEMKEQELLQVCPGIYGVTGMYEGAFIPLTRAVIMGRSHTCNLVFQEDAPCISRRHCSVTYSMTDDTFILTDMESTYGTYLADNNRIPKGKSVLLKEGEEFLIGLNERFKVGKK